MVIAKKGFSLITLIITIVIILILSGIIILSVINNGIISDSNKAKFQSDMRKFQHLLRMKIFEEILNDPNIDQSGFNAVYEPQDESQKNILDVIPEVEGEYEKKVEVESSEIIYSGDIYIEKVWSCEIGIDVKGESCEDLIKDGEENQSPIAGYEKIVNVGNVNHYEPNLTGFNKATTFYISVLEGSEQRTSINEEPPKNWYNYAERNWANIVTVNNGRQLYLTWIPRYAYKIPNYVNQSFGSLPSDLSPIDIKFVDKNNLDLNNEETIHYNDTTPNIINNSQTNYILHPAFTVDRLDTEQDNVELTGIWVSKFEATDIQLRLSTLELTPQIDGTSIKVDVTKPSTSSVKTDGYEYYLNNDTEPIKIGKASDVIEGLLPNTIYTISVRGKDVNGLYTNYLTKSVTTITKPEVTTPNAPDLTGFNKDTTYYLTYENGVENKTSINNSPPDNWYDYENKQWANIVTENNGRKLYLVWIPRYEYQKQYINSTCGIMDIKFIDVNKTVPRNGYIIHPAFIVDRTDTGQENIHLPGIWVSKFEATDIRLKLSTLELTPQIDGTSIKVDVTKPSTSTPLESGYEYYLDDGTEPIKIGKANDIIEGLLPNTTYTIRVRAKDANGFYTNFLEGSVITINAPEDTTPNAPDLTGFNPDTTSYLTYENGVENKVSINSSAPENWYNYKDKKWANIVTENNGRKLYLVWIPRYEYQKQNVCSTYGLMDIKFIPETQIAADNEYIIHPAFIVDRSDTEQESIHLPGIWVSKFEATDIQLRLSTLELTPQIDGTSIKVDVTKPSTSTPLESGYEYYLDDGTEPIKIGKASDVIQGLLPNTNYTITVKAKDKDGFYTNSISKSTITLSAPEISEPNAPDLTGFNPDTTSYLTYEGGVENKVSINNPAPENWYNYSNKQWANIVTENNGRKLYLVWIPRYEYFIDSVTDSYGLMNIKFIPKTQTVADAGYIIHPAFTVDRSDTTQDNVELSGIWVSKFEATDIKLTLSDLIITPQADGKSIKVDVIKPSTSTPLEDGYEYYINDIETSIKTGTASEIISNLIPNSYYKVTVRARDAGGNYTNYVTKFTTTLSDPDESEPNVPDLTGFNKDTTYYLTYENDIENKISIKNPAPSNWYDYENKQWANIVTENNGRKLYLVWIPRYEYQKRMVTDSYGLMDIRFIPKTKTVADDEYLIHPAFTVDRSDTEQNNIELSGIWVSKFEATDIQLRLSDLTITPQVGGRSIKVDVTKPSTSTPLEEGYEYYINDLESPIKTGTASEILDGLQPNTTYTIKVKAKDANGIYTNELVESVITLDDAT